MRARKPTEEELNDMREEFKAEVETQGPIASLVSSGQDEPCEECGHSRREHLDPYQKGYTTCEICLQQSNDIGRWNGSPCN